ncbi:MAG: diacylglycerol kinase family protein [Ferruginibacter sp.]
MKDNKSRLFFIINPGSGNSAINWETEIENYYRNSNYAIFIYKLPKDCPLQKLKDEINKFDPSTVIAAGGDGTVKLAAEAILGQNICLAILPAGSANGMAKELNIPMEPAKALAVITGGKQQSIHLLRINGELCIHLSDSGFNACLVKKFEEGSMRGQWAYVKAAWNVLWNHEKIYVEIVADNNKEKHEAVMIVLANATRYGNNVVINPEGSLTDDLFEIVIVKKISLTEIFKMRFSGGAFNKKKTAILQATAVTIHSKRKFHFQIDGEYRGKENKLEATI